ncbi:MAG: trigger factor, partial [Spirochaetota bacterium]
MIVNKEVEPLENSAVKLTVTVDQQSIKKAYDELLQKYSKTLQIKGFRRGKVPVPVLEKKFGESIKHEAYMNKIESNLKQIFEEIEEKPLPYSHPELQDELDMSMDKDLCFSVVYDTFPKIEIGTYRGLEIEEPVVELSEDDVERELKTLQNQNSIVVDKKDNTVEKDNIVTINYSELEENGREKLKSRREGFAFAAGSKNNLYQIDDDILGMKKDEEKI